MESLRFRGKTVEALSKVIRTIDAFPKVDKQLQEEKRISGGAIAIVSFALIFLLVFSELLSYVQSSYGYKFRVDNEFEKKLQVDVDLTVAMPCDLIGADITDTAEQQVFSHEQLKLQSVPFQLPQRKMSHWRLLQDLSQRKSGLGGISPVEKIVWISGLFMAAGDKDHLKPEPVVEGKLDACRVFGSVRVHKVAGTFHIILGKNLPVVGLGHAHLSFFAVGDQTYNFSHRIEKLAFGASKSGQLNTLDGTEKITKEGMTLFQYQIQVVPTRIHEFDGDILQSCQYSVTQKRRLIDHSGGSHGMPGIILKYDFSPFTIDVIPNRPPVWKFLVKLCAIVGGIFATSGILNTIVAWIFTWVPTGSAKFGDSKESRIPAKELDGVPTPLSSVGSPTSLAGAKLN